MGTVTNINKRFNRLVIFLGVFLLSLPAISTGQDSLAKQPSVTRKWQDYIKQVKDDSTKQMVELKSAIPGLVYDLRYAGANNFVHRRMYPENTTTTFLRLPVVEALAKVQAELNEQRMGLKIFDAYRPYSVTKKFWELIKDERYVANPAKGSGHNRGIAVDLTIVRLKTGAELDMGTGFDNFSDTAHHDFQHLHQDIKGNRLLLKTLMEKYGFKALDTEWWHYYWPENRFELLDIDFKKLKSP
jgi:zinc D-Ala-D-Ala dipeptidase